MYICNFYGFLEHGVIKNLNQKCQSPVKLRLKFLPFVIISLKLPERIMFRKEDMLIKISLVENIKNGILTASLHI